MASNKSMKSYEVTQIQPDNNYLKIFSDSNFSQSTIPIPQNPFEEVGLHRQFCKTFEGMKLTSLQTQDTDEKSELPKNAEDRRVKLMIPYQCVTPKSQKQSHTEVKRWASVVKAQKKLHPTSEPTVRSKLEEGGEITSQIFDCIFQTFPKNFESHKGFIISNKNLFSCSICFIELDSVLSLSNHLKTRNHENNIINFYKEKLPTHLHHTMEFVSFYGSNLCCNLCRVKINMSSQNHYETLLNIIGHNTDASHNSWKTSKETGDSAHNLFKVLIASNPEIEANTHFIEKKMNPQFKCKLCNTNILYDENTEALSKNFTSHLTSLGHTKNLKAVEVLKLFGEAHINGKDNNFIVLDGNVYCTICNFQMETNIEKLFSHVNGEEHAKNMFATLGMSSTLNKFSENKTSSQENNINEAKSIVHSIHRKDERDKEEKSQQAKETKPYPRSRLNDFLNALPLGMENVDYIIENDKGSLTCLICNRVVPPNVYNLQTHLVGINHKKNEELKKLSKSEVKSKALSCTSTNDQKIDGTNLNYITKGTSIKTDKSLLIDSFSGNVNNYIVVNDKGIIKCSVCQCCLTQDADLVHKHLKSVQHRRKEQLQQTSCSICLKVNESEPNLLSEIPKGLLAQKCHQVQDIPTTVLNHLYSLLLKRNSLVSNNQDVLVKNVDGKNGYCTLCKSLIPLSLDLDVLENNFTNHLKEKRHKRNMSCQANKTVSPLNSLRVVRSLFDISSNKKTPVHNTEFSENAASVSVDDNQYQTLDSTTEFPCSVPQSDSSLQKHGESDIFIFGKTSSTRQVEEVKSLKITKAHVTLPVVKTSQIMKFQTEMDEEVLNRRQKQITYGKITEGYKRYCQMTPRARRGFRDPVTPPKHLKCSRRTWDGIVKVWRRQLHAWDPPKLEQDIQPLSDQ